MSFDGNMTQLFRYNGNTAAAGVTGVARPARARGAVFGAGFLALTMLGGCAGNNAELAAKVNASYHTSFPANQPTVQLSSAF